MQVETAVSLTAISFMYYEKNDSPFKVCNEAINFVEIKIEYFPLELEFNSFFLSFTLDSSRIGFRENNHIYLR